MMDLRVESWRLLHVQHTTEQDTFFCNFSTSVSLMILLTSGFSVMRNSAKEAKLFRIRQKISFHPKSKP